MLKRSLILLALAGSFSIGFAVNSLLHSNQHPIIAMKKVTGIGGIFFKCKDPKKMKEWYQQHLGLNTNPYGASFEWYEQPDSAHKASTQWTPFAENSKYFEPSTKDFMINYRVENLEALVEELKKEGVTVVDKIESYDFGKFVHILDMEGNKIELWEPKE